MGKPIGVYDLISIGIGLVGVAIAVYQTIVARKTRRLYGNYRQLQEENCSTRCKDLVDTVGNLLMNARDACDAVNRPEIEAALAARQVRGTLMTLRAKTEATMTLTRELIGFCERLVAEYEYGFGRPIATGVLESLQKLPCTRLS